MSKRNENGPGYKKTKVGWIPEEWEGRYLLQTGCKVIDGDRGKEYPKQHEFGLAGHCLFLNAGNVTKEGFRFLDCHFITKEKDSKLRKGKLKRGDIVITTRGTVGSFALYNEKIEFDHIRINSGMAIIRTRTNNTNILHTFLYTLLRSHIIEKQIKRIVFGSAQPQLTIGLINRFYLSLPPLPEQKKIAEILSVWDRALEQVGKLIDANQRLKRGLMQQLLTGRMRFPEFDHGIHGIHGKKKGQLPEGWRASKISQVFKRVTRKNEAGVEHVLTVSGAHGLVDQRDYFNRSVVSKSLDGYYHIKRGEYAYNRSAMKGYTYGAIKRLNDYPEGVLSTLYLCFALSSREHCSDFFAHYFEAGLLNRQLRGIVQVGARAHGLLNVTTADFFALQIPVPFFIEQKQIASVLNACDREIELLRKKQAALREQKKGLMQKLLTGEIRHPEFLKEGHP